MFFMLMLMLMLKLMFAQETEADAIIGAPNLGIAYATSFLLGFSDACFNTQVGRAK